MRPPGDGGGPQVAIPEGRTKRDHPAAEQAQSRVSVAQVADERPEPRRRGRRRDDAPTARVSLLMPGHRRTLYWYLARCPVCGAPHLGRARDLAKVTGPRRLPCQHWATVVIARTYAPSRGAA